MLCLIVFDCFMFVAPIVVSVVAANMGSPSSYGAGDTITLTFNEATDKAGGGDSISTSLGVNALFNGSTSLGSSYSGYWSTASTFVITILDPCGASPPPQINVLYFTVQSQIRSIYSDSPINPALTVGTTTPVVSGSFANAPSILSVVASGSGTSFSSSCYLTVNFDMDTNTPTSSPTALFGFVNTDFSSSSGHWTSASSYVITNPSAPNLPPAIGQSAFMHVLASAELQNSLNTSGPSTSVAPALTGFFTQGLSI